MKALFEFRQGEQFAPFLRLELNKKEQMYIFLNANKFLGILFTDVCSKHKRRQKDEQGTKTEMQT